MKNMWMIRDHKSPLRGLESLLWNMRLLNTLNLIIALVLERRLSVCSIPLILFVPNIKSSWWRRFSSPWIGGVLTHQDE